MAKISARGALFDIAATYGTTVTVTAATAAASSVVSVGAGHGVTVGDIVEVLTGANWPYAAGRLFRVSNVATNDLTFEGFDTTDANIYPAGGFVGATVRRIVTWATLQDVRNLDISGGEQQFQDVTGITDLVGQQFPTLRSPISVSLPFWFDPSLSFLSTLRAASLAKATRALRVRLTNGGRILQNGVISYVDAPTIDGDLLQNSVTISGTSLPTVYAS